MLPGIRIRPAVVSDLEDLVRVGAAAFEHNPASAILFPERLRIKPGRHQDENEWRLQRYQKSFGKPNLHIYVAVEDVPGLERAEQVVGFTVWTSPPPQEQEQEQSSKQEVEGLGQNQGQGQGHPQPTEQQGEGNKTLDGLPPSLDKEALQKLQADTAEFVKSMLGGPAESKYWVLQAIGVHPGHKRRGIGKQLVQVGIDAAAADGIDVWLLATPEGKLLYVSMGFEIQGEKEIAGEIQTAMWKGGEEKRNQG